MPDTRVLLIENKNKACITGEEILEIAMNEERIENALKAMGSMVPRTPEKTLENMLAKVRELSKSRGSALEGAAPVHGAIKDKAVKPPNAVKGSMKL